MKHIAGFSGGIDSQALADLLLELFDPDDVLLMNSNAGENEDPLTTAHIEWYNENVHPVIMTSPIVADLGTRGTMPGKTRDRRREFAETDPLTFDRLAYIKGRFPSRKAQFCTEHLKLWPQRRVINEMFGVGGIYEGQDYERYSGVRQDESEKRKDTVAREWDSFFDCYLNHPIRYWDKKHCFDFVQARGEQINPLYTMGFNRVGCAPCVNSGKDDILAWLQVRPEMIEKVRVWEARVGRTYFPPMVPGLYINWIDDVIKWAQTSHGGRQQNFLRVINDRPNCESKYGLCE